MRQRKGKRTILGGYKPYKFTDHDPVLDQIDRLYELAGLLTPRGTPRYTQIEELSGVRGTTLRNWRMRFTKRPQHAAAKAVIRAAGGELTVVFKGKTVLPGRLIHEQQRVEQRALLKKVSRGKKAA